MSIEKVDYIVKGGEILKADGLSLDNVIKPIIGVSIGIILIASLLGPTANDAMEALTDLSTDGATWAHMVSVVVLVSIIGMVIYAIRSYTNE